MKLILMTLFVLLTLAAALTDDNKFESNRISVENINEDNLSQHPLRIQKRSLRKLFGLKSHYTPIISFNWRISNPRSFTNNNRWTSNKIYSRPSNFNIQKSIFFYNGINQVNNPSYPSTSRTTEKNLPSKEPMINVAEPIPIMMVEDEFSRPATQQTERSTSILTSTTTEPTLFSEQPTRVITETKTTQMYQSTTPTTSRPPTTSTTVTAVTTVANLQNDRFSTKSGITSTKPTTTTRVPSNIIKGGFTSTSMPLKDQYSELIYDIDPRYRRY